MEQRLSPMKPYASSIDRYLTMYDNFPYRWDKDFFIESSISMVSGNIIKSYRCIFNGLYVVKHD